VRCYLEKEAKNFENSLLQIIEFSNQVKDLNLHSCSCERLHCRREFVEWNFSMRIEVSYCLLTCQELQNADDDIEHFTVGLMCDIDSSLTSDLG
jgi:hypothetical protein